MNRDDFPSPAHRFFVTHVEPAAEEWNANATSERLGMILAVALNQLADHYFHSFPEGDPRLMGATSLRALRDELGRSCPSYLLIRDVADAHKHLTLDRPDRSLTSAEQTSVGSMGWGEADFGVGTYGGAPELVVTLDSGQRRHFSSAAQETLGMWRGLLFSN